MTCSFRYKYEHFCFFWCFVNNDVAFQVLIIKIKKKKPRHEVKINTVY